MMRQPCDSQTSVCVCVLCVLCVLRVSIYLYVLFVCVCSSYPYGLWDSDGGL
jgi:hypothetical protein